MEANDVGVEGWGVARRKVTLAGFCDLWSFCGLLTIKGVYKYCVRLRSVFCSVCFVAVRRGSGYKGRHKVFLGALGINIFFFVAGHNVFVTTYFYFGGGSSAPDVLFK